MNDEYTRMEAEMEFEPQPPDKKDVAYYTPATLEEAERLKTENPGLHYLGGGTILNWRGSPRVKGLIDLKSLSLSGIEVTSSQIIIGATATIQDVAGCADLPKPISLAAGLFSSTNVRNMATVGGTATGKFFVSDLLPVLLAYNADVEYFQGQAKAVMPLAQWLNDRRGMICSVILRQLQRSVAFKQEKISKIDFPLIVTAIGWDIADKQIHDPCVAISGASGKIVLSQSGAAYLAGKDASAIDVDALNAAVQQDVQPTETIKASPRVKRGIIASHLQGIVRELRKEGTL